MAHMLTGERINLVTEEKTPLIIGGTQTQVCAESIDLSTWSLVNAPPRPIFKFDDMHRFQNTEANLSVKCEHIQLICI